MRCDIYISQLPNLWKVSADADWAARRRLTPNRPSRCTQSWTLSVINKCRSTVNCWPHLTRSTVARRCQHRPTIVACHTRRPAVARFSKSRVWDYVSEGSNLVFEISRFPYNTVQDKSEKARMPKASSIRAAVSVPYYRLVTDIQTLLAYS